MSRALNQTPHAFISQTKKNCIKMAKHHIYLQRSVVYHKKVVKQADLSPGLIFFVKLGKEEANYFYSLIEPTGSSVIVYKIILTRNLTDFTVVSPTERLAF